MGEIRSKIKKKWLTKRRMKAVAIKELIDWIKGKLNKDYLKIWRYMVKKK